ncbi:aminoacyl tRNA synthase complex-interacting multifunctional protein 1-like [Diadema setosum]|uniref:aminoacyl tRNA synthase complex-interacting multifunctional protein 1-like n=1 Tax=Diadema setosum TaxID=31175 RepID=UPI003B3B23DD
MFVARLLATPRVMAASSAVIQRLEQRAQLADEIILRLQQEVQALRRTVASREEQRLVQENTRLKEDVKQLKDQLIAAEIRNGLTQVPLPSLAQKPAATVMASPAQPPAQPPAPVAESKSAPTPAAEGKGKKEGKKQKKEKSAKEPKKDGKQEAAASDDVDIRNLDLRIGKIVNVKKHPDADSLYVEEVELGEAQPRTVVSGLVKHIPIEQMQDRMVVLCCNLKPAKMRGILSQAMVMCASSPDKVEILQPPAGAAPGDRVGCEGYELGDFPPQMNPKKKIFERIQPHLLTNDDLQATYKGARWHVEGKGHIIAATMSKSGIK